VNIETYVKERFENQLAWYEQKARWARKRALLVQTYQILCVCAAVILCGCATPLERVELAKDEVEKVRRIALLRVNESQNITARTEAPAIGFIAGGLGAAAVELANVDRAQKFSQLINESKLFMGPDMAAALQQTLTAQGFEVEYLAHTVPKLMSDGSTLDYSDISTDADAILNVWFGDTGYHANSPSAAYRPWTVVHVRLLDARSKKIWYHAVFSGGVAVTNENALYVPGCEKPRYQNEESLLSNPREAVGGIKGCHRMLAQSIARSLRPAPLKGSGSNFLREKSK
jgi:hypothetical protein